MVLHDNFGKGLELSFNMMISLAAAEFQININGGLVFVGYQTVLVPTEIQKNFAQFHLITSTEGQINPYALDFGERVITDDPFQFKRMRCFLGWCEVVQVNLGTRELISKVKYSGGKDKGKPLTLDGYAVMLQVGTSAPLSAVMRLQTNFKYTSHRPQFTPSSCFSKLLQDTARDLAIVYDVSQRRGWLVPKPSLLLHMSHAYALSCVDVPDDRVPYVEPHADAGEIIKVLEPLGDTRIYGEQTDTFLFQELKLGLNINLISSIESIRKSARKKLYGFEFMDVVTAPGRGTCMKQVSILSMGSHWLDLVNVVDAVVVCSDLGEVVTAVAATTNGRKNIKCNHVPKEQDFLAATLPCLARVIERRGGELSLSNLSHRLRVSEYSFWDFKGDPFRPCEHENKSKETCWTRNDLVQRLEVESKFESLLPARKIAAPIVKQFPLSGAIVFGSRRS